MDSFRHFLPAFVFIAGLTASNVFCAHRPEMNGAQNDASDVTWAHAVNSWDSLEKALAGPIDFMEADISLGHVEGHEQTPAIPIMAHPPDVTSDISLDTWLSTVLARGPQKGVKLDFKSLEVLEPSLIILEKYASKLNGSLWLSADILPGPVSPRKTPVHGDQFLALCSKHFPRATLSLGWTTNWIRRFPVNSWRYEWKHVRQMADAVRCRFKGKHPSITFSVRAVYASRSFRQLRWLLRVIPGSTLLVWSGTGDSVNADDILRIQESFPNGHLYYNLPDTLYKQKNRGKSKAISKKSKDSSAWVTVTRDENCKAFTYIDDNTIVFGTPSNSAVLQKNLVSVDRSRNFTLSGRLKFFAGDLTLNPTHWEHKLNVIFADVRRLSKHAISYSKKKLTYNVRDPEILWSAVNSSVLYTFEHQYFQDNTACRMFKVDVRSNLLLFEAWTIPCDVTYDDNSYEEVSEGSIPEIRLEETLDGKDGMFMVGFHSFGEEHVLAYDLNLVTEVKEKETALVLPKLQLALTSSNTKLRENLLLIIILFLPTLPTFLNVFIVKDMSVKIY